MEQIYFLEILIDKVCVFVKDDDPPSNTEKNLITNVKFGPKVQFIIKEGQMVPSQSYKADVIDCDENGNRKWCRTVRVGKSYLFPSFPDKLLETLSKFPLELEVWTDDLKEVKEFVGVGTMHWDPEFYVFLQETANPHKLHEPLAYKQLSTMLLECCCARAGEITFFLRLSALGQDITTEFQQLTDQNPVDSFTFRSNRAPTMYKGVRIEGDDPNFCMIGPLYETVTLEDPDSVGRARKKIEVCTEMQPCGGTQTDGPCRRRPCDTDGDREATPKQYTIEKIRMGDIIGPCGNTNCLLASKIRNYIRTLDAYKTATKGKTIPDKTDTSHICGSCGCKDERWHRDTCPEVTKQRICKGCGGVAKSGDTCEDTIKKLHGVSPKDSKDKSNKDKQVNYMIGTTHDPELMKSLFGSNYCVNNCQISFKQDNTAPIDINVKGNDGDCVSAVAPNKKAVFATEYTVNNCHIRDLQANFPPGAAGVYGPGGSHAPGGTKMCRCGKKTPACPKGVDGLGGVDLFDDSVPPRGSAYYETIVYNATESKAGRVLNNFVTNFSEDTECKCNPPHMAPPCKTFDCDCINIAKNIDSRKLHKPYCPLYKHKPNCPVTMMKNDEEEEKEEEPEEAEPLPYGLPPIQLGPCPVLGRPCSVPDGFARMFKTAVQPTQPPSYSDAGKVCCSKEFERIKKALKEYMSTRKGDDYRCINKFYVDTERRCCDKEQRLLNLTGKSCCGAHKLAQNDQFKEQREKEESAKRHTP